MKLDSAGNGGFDGFSRLSPPARRLRADHCAHPVSASGPPLALAGVRLAELRPVSEISGATAFPRLLGGETGRAVAFGDGGAFPADPAGGAADRERRIPPALR